MMPQIEDTKPNLKRVVNPITADFHWMSGIYEGDGSCQLTNTGSVTVQVTQKDRWILDKMRNLFGGSVLPHAWDDYSGYRWSACGARARGLLQSIFELLSPRRQAQIRKVLGWA